MVGWVNAVPRVAAALVVTLVLWSPQPSAAAACCGAGNTPGRAGQLAANENLSIGVGWSLGGLTARWSDDGSLSGRQGEEAVLQTIAPWFTVRPQAQLQAGVVVPIVVQKLTLSGKEHYGGGLGDLLFWVQWEPMEGSVRRKYPVPIVGLGLELPTGVSIDQMSDDNPAMATGTGRVALKPSLQLQQTLQRNSLSARGEMTFALPRPGRPDLGVPGVSWGVGLSVAWYLTTRATFSLSGGMAGRTAGLQGGVLSGRASHHPWMGVALSLSPNRSSRWSFGVRHSLPIPRLGRNDESRLLFSITGSWIGSRLWVLHRI